MKLKIFTAVVFTVILAGCGFSKDYTEPEKRVIVTALAIDKENEKLKLKAEALISPFEGNTEIIIFSSEGNDIVSAVGNLENISYGSLFLSQCPVVILGKNINGDTQKQIFYYFFLNNSISLSARFAYCENALSLLDSENKIKPEGYEIEELLNSKNSSLGITDTESYVEIINKLQKGKNSFTLPVINKTSFEYKINGICLVDEFYVSEIFDIRNSQIFSALTGRLLPCNFTTDTTVLKIKKTKLKDEILEIRTEHITENKDFSEEYLNTIVYDICKNSNVKKWLKNSETKQLPENIRVILKGENI